MIDIAPPRRIGLIVEDQADTRTWLVDILGQTFPGMEIAQAANFTAARSWLRARRSTADTLAFTIALVDIGLPDGSGIDLIRDLNAHHVGALPIVTTIYNDDTHLFDAIAAGAKGYLLKDQDADMLAHYLRRIEMGDPPLSPSIARRMLEHFRTHPPMPRNDTPAATLTPRETEVLRLIGRGLRVAEAARVLELSEHTVADYVKAIYAKLNISSRAEAGLEAARRGLT